MRFPRPRPTVGLAGSDAGIHKIQVRGLSGGLTNQSTVAAFDHPVIVGTEKGVELARADVGILPGARLIGFPGDGIEIEAGQVVAGCQSLCQTL